MILTTKDKIKVLKPIIIKMIIVLIFFIVLLLMLKYAIEGESKKNLPFYIEDITVASTADSIKKDSNEFLWCGDLVQINDIYLKISKNENKDGAIKNIYINNFQIEKPIYPANTDISKIHSISYDGVYANENLQEIQFIGSEKTSLENLSIGNQGGTIGFRFLLTNLGEYKSNETQITHDGTLLQNLNIQPEQLKCKISFDCIIETDKGIKYKTNISLDLPSGDIMKEGYSIKEIPEADLIFKRIPY